MKTNKDKIKNFFIHAAAWAVAAGGFLHIWLNHHSIPLLHSVPGYTQ